jgi:hypothetical protein
MALQNLGIPNWFGKEDQCLSNDGTSLTWANQCGGDGQAVFVSPDYANQSADKASGTSSASWTADASGFVSVNAGLTGYTSGATIERHITINGQEVEEFLWYDAVLVGTNLNTIHPIAAGDQIEVSLVSFGNVSVHITFIPPKYSRPPTPIVVEGGDYSTSEQAVMVNDNGTQRAKLWVDGKPIYQRSVTVAAAMGSWNAGVDKAIVADITSWNIDKFVKPAEGVSGNGYVVSFSAYKSGTALALAPDRSYLVQFATTTNNVFTVWYTKTTDTPSP